MRKLLPATLLGLFALPAMAGNDTLPNGKPFQNLQDQINVINLTIAQQKVIYDAKFAQLAAKDGSHDELIAALTVALNLVMARVGDNEEDIEALQLADSLHEQLMQQLTDRLTSLENSTSANFTALYDQDRVLNQLIAALESRLTSLQNSYNASAAQLDDLENEVNSYRLRLTSLGVLLNSFCSSGQVVTGIYYDGRPRCSDVKQLGNYIDRSANMTAINFCDQRDPVLGICIDEDYYESGSVFCPSGYVATGGGLRVGGFDDMGGNDWPLISRPSGNGWFAQSTHHGNQNWTAIVYVRCLYNN